MGLHEKAISELTSSTVIDKSNPEPYNLRGISYTKLKNFTLAINDFSESIKLQNGQNADTYYNRGICYYDAKRYNDAIEDFDFSLDLYNKYIAQNSNLTLSEFQKFPISRTFYFRSKAYTAIKNYFKASEDMDNAISLYPKIKEIDSIGYIENENY
jgi:tetratricopeptide (TPR) repeat protein